MMYRFVRRCALIALAFLLLAGTALAEGAESVEVLVVYKLDVDGKVGRDLQALSQILLYSGRQAAFCDADEAGNWPGFEASIVLIDPGARLSSAAVRALAGAPCLVIGEGGLREMMGATGAGGVLEMSGEIAIQSEFLDGESVRRHFSGTLSIPEQAVDMGVGTLFCGDWKRPLAAAWGNSCHMAFFDGDDAGLVSDLATLIQRWRWPYLDAPPAFGQYLVLNELYPFYDLNQLMAVAGMLGELGVPYSVSVMPVFQHAEYPAMKRFAETLRYMQGRGASIILRCPQVRIADTDPWEMINYLDDAYGAYARYGVYPAAIQAPKAWLYDQTGIEVLRRFRTVFLFDTDEKAWTPSAQQHAIYRDGHRFVAPAFEVLNAPYARTSAFSSAVYLDARKDVQALRSEVLSVLRSRVQIMSLADSEQSVFLNKNGFSTASGRAIYNGDVVSLRYEPFEYDEKFDFQRGFAGYMRAQIVSSNRVTMSFALVSCVVFLCFIWWGRRAIRKSMFYGGDHAR